MVRLLIYFRIVFFTLGIFSASHRMSHAAEILINTPTIASQALANTDNITITDTGSIDAPGNAVSAVAVTAGAVDNSGTVSGVTTGVLSAFNSDFTGGVLNRAGATLEGGDWGIALGFNGGLSGGVNNFGLIQGGTYGLYVTLASDMTGAVVNRQGATLTGDIGIRVESTSAISGGIFNSGTIEGTGGTAISFAGLNASTPITLDGGRVIGDITDDTPANNFSPVTIAGDFATEGDIRVSSLGIDAGQRLTINAGDIVMLDNMSASAGAALTFGVLNAGAGGAGQLVVNGAGQALNLSGLVLSVAVSGGALANGDEILIADGAAAIVGGPVGVRQRVDDNSFAFNFEIADGTAATAATDASDLFLFVVPGSTCSGSSATIGNANACNTMQALDPSADAQLQQAITNMNSAGNDAALNEVLESVQPAVDGGAVVASLATMNTSLGLVTRRIEDGHESWESGVAAGRYVSPLRGWGQAFGSYATQGTRQGINGYDATMAGLTMGVDAGYDTGSVVGLAVSYGRARVQSDNANNTETDLVNYQATVYGELGLGQNGFVRGMGAYVRSDVENERYNVGGAGGPTALGTYNASQYSLRAEAGRGVNVDQYTTVTPSVMAHWTHYDAEDYTETGAGGANLSVRPESLNIFELGAGLDVQWDITNQDGSRFVPEVRAGYRYDFIGDRVETSSAFTGGGASFASQGAAPSRHRMNIGASISYHAEEDWSVKAIYDLDYKEDYRSHAVRLESVIKF